MKEIKCEKFDDKQKHTIYYFSNVMTQWNFLGDKTTFPKIKIIIFFHSIFEKKKNWKHKSFTQLHCIHFSALKKKNNKWCNLRLPYLESDCNKKKNRDFFFQILTTAIFSDSHLNFIKWMTRFSNRKKIALKNWYT